MTFCRSKFDTLRPVIIIANFKPELSLIEQTKIVQQGLNMLTPGPNRTPPCKFSGNRSLNVIWTQPHVSHVLACFSAGFSIWHGTFPTRRYFTAKANNFQNLGLISQLIGVSLPMDPDSWNMITINGGVCILS